MDVAAEAAGLGNRTTAKEAETVVEQGTEELVEAMDAEKVSIRDAAYAAGESPEDQLRALDKLEKGEAKTLRQALNDKGGTKRGKKGGKGGKGGAKAKPIQYSPDVPKDVQNAMADVWHLECAASLAKMRTEAKKAVQWSGWLDGVALMAALKTAEECFRTAAPKKICPDCKGKKMIDGDGCVRCRQQGYLGSQVVEKVTG